MAIRPFLLFLLAFLMAHGAVAFDSQYTYDPNGQITAINDRSPANDDRTYGYDGLNRLVSASGPWGTGSFSYDNRNNLTSKRLGSITRSIWLIMQSDQPADFCGQDRRADSRVGVTRDATRQ